MSDQNRNCSNDAIKKIIGNVTAEKQNLDGQYVPLAFTPPPTTESLGWTQPSPAYLNHNHNHFNVHNAKLELGYAPMEQFAQPPPPYNFMQQPVHLYGHSFNKNLNEYEMYKNGNTDIGGMFDTDFQSYVDPLMLNTISDHHVPQTQPDLTNHGTNHTQLIENLVGNWVVPNNSGTYTPFGNPDYKSNANTVFEIPSERDVIGNSVINQIIDEPKFNQILEQPLEEKQFLFSRDRDAKKPRMIAEIKPMRPSYSDVLTKPVPQTTTKPLKNDVKESKPNKKDTKKNMKNDKSQKANSTLNRSNTNNDIKDVNADKNYQFSKNDKSKVNKTNQLNRKWASLDNIAEPMNSNKMDDSKRKKVEDATVHNKSYPKSSRKFNKVANETTDNDSENYRSEMLNITKNNLKKANKSNTRQKSNESFGSNERPPGKRNQRTRKRESHVPFGIVGQKLKQYLKGWWKMFTVFILWLFHLISDICSLSIHISRDFAFNFWQWLSRNWSLLLESTIAILKRIRLFVWVWEKFKKKQEPEEDTRNFAHNGLQHNINMPTTGDEAMKRLLACKGKDPYSILGVTPSCTDDDIKRYYKRQAFLVHPDKNQQPGAEEAFKILVHAFDMIGEPERRATYDRGVVESAQVVQAWSELTELLSQLQQKVEAAANTIRCSACGLRHRRVKVDRPSYAARNCSSCKIHHAAREGDIWAEARCFGFLWNYFACMEGAVYDITDWAGCQKGSLKHLKPDSHHVQYRIALGKQNSQPRRPSASPRSDRPDLENLLNTFNTLYGQSDSGQGGTRRRSKKSNK